MSLLKMTTPTRQRQLEPVAEQLPPVALILLLMTLSMYPLPLTAMEQPSWRCLPYLRLTYLYYIRPTKTRTPVPPKPVSKDSSNYSYTFSLNDFLPRNFQARADYICGDTQRLFARVFV
jgi:hypothetical protein